MPNVDEAVFTSLHREKLDTLQRELEEAIECQGPCIIGPTLAGGIMVLLASIANGDVRLVRHERVEALWAFAQRVYYVLEFGEGTITKATSRGELPDGGEAEETLHEDSEELQCWLDAYHHHEIGDLEE